VYEIENEVKIKKH